MACRVKGSDEDKQRCENLRNSAIEQLKRLVVDNPTEYDSAKLPKAIDYVKALSDDHIDAALILGNHLDIIQRPIYCWTDDEIQKVHDMLTKYNYVVDTEEVNNDEAERSDYMARYKKDDNNLVIWLNKSRPMFGDSGVYNILAVGMSFPNTNASSIDYLMELLDKQINYVLKYE